MFEFVVGNVCVVDLGFGCFIDVVFGYWFVVVYALFRALGWLLVFGSNCLLMW